MTAMTIITDLALGVEAQAVPDIIDYPPKITIVEKGEFENFLNQLMA